MYSHLTFHKFSFALGPIPCSTSAHFVTGKHTLSVTIPSIPGSASVCMCMNKILFFSLILNILLQHKDLMPSRDIAWFVSSQNECSTCLALPLLYFDFFFFLFYLADMKPCSYILFILCDFSASHWWRWHLLIPVFLHHLYLLGMMEQLCELIYFSWVVLTKSYLEEICTWMHK